MIEPSRFSKSPMPPAPIGAIISYWLRPQRDRMHIHRIEVEHALYLAAATQEQIKDTLTVMLRQQTESLGRISQSLDDLREEIATGFSAVGEGLAIVDDTLHRGFYQLHLDSLGTNARLDDLLLLLYDKEGYRRELAARQAADEAHHVLHNASNEFSQAMALTRRALNESNLAKAGAMLDEAVVLFHRASDHPAFALEAHFQLGYLAQQHQRNFDAAYDHYRNALGPPYSAHYIRTARHLAHLDYLTGRKTEALAKMQDLIAHDMAISAFASDLQQSKDQPWENRACILALQKTLEAHSPLLSRCARLSVVQQLFNDERHFTATEHFLESYSLIMKELHALHPELRVYFDAARYASVSGSSALAVPWIKHCYRAQATLSARRVFLIEAMADDDLRQGEVGTFLREALAVAEREKTAREKAAAERQKAMEEASASEQMRAQAAARAAAAEAQRLRRNAASSERARFSAGGGAILGGIVMGLAGCVSCATNARFQGVLVTDFNLFSGLLLGAIGGAMIGAAIGYYSGQNVD